MAPVTKGTSNKLAVVLLSGGLDSMVCAALAREAGFSVLALTIDYNQRHRVELEAAKRIAPPGQCTRTCREGKDQDLSCRMRTVPAYEVQRITPHAAQENVSVSTYNPPLR